MQTLRTQIRNARREQADNKPPKAFRMVFKLLKDIIPEPGGPVKPARPEDDDEDAA